MAFKYMSQQRLSDCCGVIVAKLFANVIGELSDCTCIIRLSEWSTVSKCIWICTAVCKCVITWTQWLHSHTALQSQQGDLWYGNLSLCKNLHQCHYSPCASGEHDWLERMERAEFIEMLQRYSQKSFTWLLAARSHECTQRSWQMCAFTQNKGIWEQDCERGSVTIEWKIISRCPWRRHLLLTLENWRFFLFSLIYRELKRWRHIVSFAILKLLDVNKKNSIALSYTFFWCHFYAKIHHCVKIQPRGVTSMAQSSFSVLLRKKSLCTVSQKALNPLKPEPLIQILETDPCQVEKASTFSLADIN